MSVNAGKVMLGADGHVMRGHAGEIVLADNLYPMHASASFVGWYREFYWNSNNPARTDNGVWGETWGDGGNFTYSVILNHTAMRDYDGVLWTYWRVGQAVRKYTLSGVDWPRVAKMKVSYLLRSYCYPDDYPIPYKWYWGINNATAPSGSNEPWEGTGWTLLANVTATYQTAYDYGVIDVTGCNGTFWLAGFADVTTLHLNPAIDESLLLQSGSSHSFYGYYGGITYPALIWDIVYNLAT